MTQGWIRIAGGKFALLAILGIALAMTPDGAAAGGKTRRGYLDVLFTMLPMAGPISMIGGLDCKPVLPEDHMGIVPFTISGNRIKSMLDIPEGLGAEYVPPCPGHRPIATPTR